MLRYFIFLIGFLVVFSCNTSPKGITIEKVDDPNIYARLISKNDNANRPLVILVPGSGNSFIKNEILFGLVDHGYDMLSIAYKGVKKLPKKIEHVPLEYLEKIVLWSKSNFPNRKIVILGISKGAEYSLAFASHYDLIDGLICYTPSAFILPNHVELKQNEVQKSSWSFDGKEIPFATLKPFDDKAGKIVYKKYIDPIFENVKQIETSRIKVENIKCDLLLLTGKDDMVWPASKMADLIIDTIKNKGQNNLVKHVAYQNCGHQFVWFDDKVPSSAPQYQSLNLTGIKKHKFLFGGTKEGTTQAMINSRDEVFKFLEKF